MGKTPKQLSEDIKGALTKYIQNPMVSVIVNNFSGTFSQQVIHDWISGCLPEIPPRLQQDTVTLLFRNVFTGSVLKCEYCKGEATISSDSVTTIAILKEHISQEAVRLRITLTDTFQARLPERRPGGDEHRRD